MATAWLVYALKNTAGKAAGRLSYVGATVDLARRLRQHNGEIVGGAKYTTLPLIPSIERAVRFLHGAAGFPTKETCL